MCYPKAVSSLHEGWTRQGVADPTFYHAARHTDGLKKIVVLQPTQPWHKKAPQNRGAHEEVERVRRPNAVRQHRCQNLAEIGELRRKAASLGC